MARAALAAPIVSESIRKILSASAVAAAGACTDGEDEDPECKLGWIEATSKWESGSANGGNLGEMFNAMEVVQVLLYPGAKALESAPGVGAGNGTQNGGPSNTGTGAPPANTGAAGSVGVSLSMVLAGIVTAVLAF
jgi:mannan endo-1,6-alpha-mannosidase